MAGHGHGNVSALTGERGDAVTGEAHAERDAYFSGRDMHINNYSDRPSDGKKHPEKTGHIIIKRLDAGSLQSDLFTVLIDGTEQKKGVTGGRTAIFDVPRGWHTVQVKSGDYESSERSAFVWWNWTLTTKRRRGKATEELLLRPPGSDGKSIAVMCLVMCALVFLFLASCLYLKDVSFADYVTDTWHWYGSPWSVPAGECLHYDTQTYSSDGPMVVVPCSSAAANYTLLGIVPASVYGSDPTCEDLTGWSAAEGGETVFGERYGHPGEILCAMPPRSPAELINGAQPYHREIGI